MVVGTIRFRRLPCPARSARLPATLDTYPGKTATELVTLASTVGRPIAIRLGKGDERATAGERVDRAGDEAGDDQQGDVGEIHDRH